MTGSDIEGDITNIAISAGDIAANSGGPLITALQYDYDVRGELSTIEAGGKPFATGSTLYGHSCSAIVWGGSSSNIPSSDCGGVPDNTGTYTFQAAQSSVDPFTGATFTGSLNGAVVCPAGNIQTYGSVLAYDKDGRQVSDTVAPQTNCANSQGSLINSRSYDAENHLTQYNCETTAYEPECFFSDDVPYLPTEQFAWGPNGKLRYAYSPNAPSGAATLHWDGDSLLFISGSNGNLVETDVEMLGAVQTSGASYMEKPATGLVVNDHDFAGATAAMHWSGHDDFWVYGSSFQRLTSQGWYQQTACICNDYAAAFEPMYSVNGQRSDGYLIFGMIFQGGRTYDQGVQQWSQPDSYHGDLSDPMSQRGYMWNRNDPIAYGDPSGFDPLFNFLPPVLSSGGGPVQSSSGCGICGENLAWMALGDLLGFGAPEEGAVEGNLARMAEIESVATTSEVLAPNSFRAIGSTGQIGEDALKELGGDSQEYFRTALGGRYIDQLVGGWANESKVGYQSLTAGNRLQALKDLDLISKRQIGGSTWHFFTSPVTGLGGPSDPLMQFLEGNGIGVIIH